MPFSNFYKNGKKNLTQGCLLVQFSWTCQKPMCLPHDLLIAKLETYGLENDSLNLLLDYLSFRKQRTKVGSVYSKLSKISRGILQGSILGPLLFNLFINDIAHDCRAIRFLQFCR